MTPLATVRRTAYAVVLFSFVAMASDSGTIRGRVYLGEEKEVHSGILISVVGSAVRTQTSPDGTFALSMLPEGTYELDISFIGYKRERLTGVQVQSGRETDVTVLLSPSPFLLNEVVVTGSLNKHLLKDTPVVTELISEKDLASAGSPDLSDVMRFHTGVEIGTSIGQTQSARLNGLNKNQVLVLVDGERLSGKVDGAVDLGQIPLNTIEKIEIVKGPLSSIYGTDALGGVVNVITKSPKTSPTLSLGSGFGSFGRRDLVVSAGTASDSAFGDQRAAGILFNAGWVRFGGVDYDRRDYFTEMPESDRRNADVKAYFRFGGRLFLDLKGQYYKDDIRWLAGGDRIVSFVDFARNEKATFSGATTYLLSLASSLKLSAHLTRNNHWSWEETADGVVLRSSLSRESIQAYRAQLTTTPYAASILTLGYEATLESANSERIKGRTQRTTNHVLYAEDEWAFSNTTVSFGARYSDNSAFGTFFAPRLSVLYRASSHLSLRGSYGRGFRAPSILELYIDYDNSGVGYVVQGEPGLRPETSHGFNAGFDYSRDDLVWFRVNAYYNSVSNLINYYRVQSIGTNAAVLSYRNIAEGFTGGADVDVDLRFLQSLKIEVGYSYLTAKDGSGNELPFHSPNTASLKLGYRFESFGTDGMIRCRWRDRQLVMDDQVNAAIYSGDADPQLSRVPSTLTVDASLSKQFFGSLTLTGGINNATNQTRYPFGQIKGRELFLSMTYVMN